MSWDALRHWQEVTERCAASGVEVWTWVLMPNRVHLILVSSDEDARDQRTGHFLQSRRRRRAGPTKSD